MPSRYVPYVVAAVVLLLALLALALRARKRWKEGRQAVEELRQQSKSMHLEQQGMATSVSEASTRRKP